MGGKAFANAFANGEPTINVQRLSDQQYHYLCRRTCEALKKHFSDAEVITPPTFASKESFGDIDILLSTQQSIEWLSVAQSLGGRAFIDTGSAKAPSCSLALRLDGLQDGTAKQYRIYTQGKVEHSGGLTEETYAQVDVSCSPSKELRWRSFYSSYGDLGMILGRIARYFGFRFSSAHGLAVELEEYEAFKEAGIPLAESEGRIHLSSDLDDIIQWLQLDQARYAHGFWDTDELFEWLEGCKLMLPELPVLHRKDTRDEARSEVRPTFAAFMAWQTARQTAASPSITEAGRVRTRQRLLLDAVDFFGKQEEVDARTKSLKLQLGNAVANNHLREELQNIPQLSKTSIVTTLRGFRRFVGVEDGRPVILHQPLPDSQSQLHYFLDQSSQSLDPHFISWAKEHCAELQSIELASTSISTELEMDQRFLDQYTCSYLGCTIVRWSLKVVHIES